MRSCSLIYFTDAKCILLRSLTQNVFVLTVHASNDAESIKCFVLQGMRTLTQKVSNVFVLQGKRTLTQNVSNVFVLQGMCTLSQNLSSVFVLQGMRTLTQNVRPKVSQ
jgi:hypothetical protein